jgi:hypothetical protein
MARPTKLTPDLMQRICLHLQYGATHKAAAAAEGIDEKTFYNWLRRPRFFQSVERAEALARTEKLRLLHVAACRGNVQAITWLLERLEPQLYGKVASELPALVHQLLLRLEPSDAARVLCAWGLGPPLVAAPERPTAALEGELASDESTDAVLAQGPGGASQERTGAS